MGKSKPDRRSAHKIASRKARRSKQTTATYDPNLASSLLAQAQSSLSTNDLDAALRAAQKAAQLLQVPSAQSPCLEQLPAFEVLGVVYLELGDPTTAQDSFLLASQVDPDGEHAGAEKFLWLAQLSEEGGQDTIQWLERGIKCLQRSSDQLAQLLQDGSAEGPRQEEIRTELRIITDKIANALCSAAEVYMTDLSFEDDCEEKCERFAEQAAKVAPSSPVVLQTLANIRVSQQRIEEARQLLEQSMSIWDRSSGTKRPGPTDEEAQSDDEEESGDIGFSDMPDFATRISLCRLLMEVEMSPRALSILERLTEEDDSSVEAWYLGGWCQHLIISDDNSAQEDEVDGLQGCEKWLQRCLEEYGKQQYEDDRLRDHATTLHGEVKARLKTLEPMESEAT
ncbi:MAG: hypothetical protein Q9159_004311 [Coniocarpon cinnabarinum]